MAKNRRLKMVQRIFEVRYVGGYRYLDRCGEAMLILEDLLQRMTEKVWLPAEMLPTGARLKCPELDMTVVFDTHRLGVDQAPVGPDCDFNGICRSAFDTVKARFGIGSLERLGARQISVLATDSIEEAETVSMEKAIASSNGLQGPVGMKGTSADLSLTFETEDHSKGAKVRILPSWRIGAQLEADQRLSLHPRLLPRGQREALVEQLRRAKAREQDPDVGLVVDVDYYWVRPGDEDVSGFLKKAWQETDGVAKQFAGVS